MDNKNENHTTSMKPYDESMWENWTIYDNVPYTRDFNLRSEKSLTMESGNIIKGYRCLMKEPYEVKH